MKSTDPEIQKIIKRPFTIANLDELVEREFGEVTTWPALINRALRPTMFFIKFVPQKEGPRKNYVVTKENWCALYTLFTGKDLEYYKPRNMIRTLVCEPPVAVASEGHLIFATRKNWYKIAIITLFTVRISWFLLGGFGLERGIGLDVIK